MNLKNKKRSAESELGFQYEASDPTHIITFKDFLFIFFYFDKIHDESPYINEIEKLYFRAP